MLIDSRLTFIPYIASIERGVKYRTNVMRGLAKTSGGTSDRVLRSFYVHAVRSCVDYGTPCLMAAAPATLQPLETAQHSALRVILGAPLWTKCICLRAEGRMSSVAMRVTQLSVGHLVALLRHRGLEPLRVSVRPSYGRPSCSARGHGWRLLPPNLDQPGRRAPS